MRRLRRSVYSFFALILTVNAVAVPPAAFTEEALSRGLSFQMASFPQSQGYLGQGCGFADLDGDGDQDIILLGSPIGRVGIFENIGGGQFVDRSATSGIPQMVAQQGFAAADYDADGRIDLYLTQHADRNRMMRNLGNFTFENMTIFSRAYDDGPATAASWGDIDGDGWLDVYVANYSAFEPHNRNVLYRNLGDGTFSDEGNAYGVNSGALSFQAVWTDYDKDGDQDLYLSNDRGPLGFTPNQLWRNDGGVMTDVSAMSGANVSLFSMGLAAGDFDGNGYPDYYTTNINTPDFDGINPLILNQGDGTFIESAVTAGVANYITSWGAVFFDYDNNGHKDLYVNNMWVGNSFFVNMGSFPVSEMAAALGVQASFDPNYDPDNSPPATIASFCSAVADVDNDGDIDLLVNNVGGRAELFINQEGQTRNYLRYRIVGEYPNLDAIGVQVETTVGGVIHFDESYAGGNGYLGQNELILHVGLDQATFADQVDVRWPSGGPTRTLTDLPANETWSIYPPSRLCDADGAGIDIDDFIVFVDCFASGFAPGCEMMDWSGNSTIYAEDLFGCFVSQPSDCNGNGQEDRVEMLFDPALDSDRDGEIDCCAGTSLLYPNPVGDSLVLAKDGAGSAILGWSASAVDLDHGAALSYDVFVTENGPQQPFAVDSTVATTSYAHPLTGSTRYFLINARNDCGSSGEEPF